MNLYLAEKAFKMNITLKAIKKDIEDVLDPLYNWDKIYERLIMNAKIGRDENVDIKTKSYHIMNSDPLLVLSSPTNQSSLVIKGNQHYAFGF